MNVRGIFVTDPKQQRSSSQNNISKIKFFLKRINCALFLFIECAKCKAKHSECKSLAVLNGVADGIGLSVTQTLFLFSSYCQSVPRARNSINFFVYHFFTNDLQDEVLAISDKVVIRANDLLNWCDDTINWRWGLRATTMRNEAPNTHKCDSIVKSEAMNDNIKIEPDEIEAKTNATENEKETETPGVRSLKNSLLDFHDIDAEKGK